MAKTFRNLFTELTSFENLWDAYRKARRGKRYKEPAAWFDYRVLAFGFAPPAAAWTLHASVAFAVGCGGIGIC